MEQTYQQLMEQQQAAQQEARQLSTAHAAEMRELRAQLAAHEADVARLTASEQLYKHRNNELYNQVCRAWVACVACAGVKALQCHLQQAGSAQENHSSDHTEEHSWASVCFWLCAAVVWSGTTAAYLSEQLWGYMLLL